MGNLMTDLDRAFSTAAKDNMQDEIDKLKQDLANAEADNRLLIKRNLELAWDVITTSKQLQECQAALTELC